MFESTLTPQVFISYSWSPPQHKAKVIAFAERLVRDGVRVILDVWHLAPGQDKNVFMEQTVNNQEIKRVLLICNKSYAEKANGRQGGVGAESMIMSKKVYESADQTKFIPLVFEADEKGEAYMPTFVNTRIYFDLRDTDHYESEYEQLMRNIFDRPVHTPPPLGVPPAYITEDRPVSLPTAHRVEAIKRAFLDGRPNAQMLVRDYYDAFLGALQALEPSEGEVTPDNFIDFALGRIAQLKPLRDDFVHFWETYLSVAEVSPESVNRFFERLAVYHYSKLDNGYRTDSIGSLQYDYLRYFAYELVLHFASITLKAERFDLLADFLYDKFIVPREHTEPAVANFLAFGGFNQTLNKYRNEKLQLNRVSVVADTIKERATEKYPFEELKQADILLYYISDLLDFTPNRYSISTWRPETSAYRTLSLPVLDKIISQRYFDRIKVLFGAANKEELIDRVKALEADPNARIWARSDYWMHRNVADMSRALKLDKIGMVK